ncbi:ribonuclease inhibitor-like isoform X1 [Carassius auratus]|uniref:Ribonuclease inhibitor-like isoform X1 n=1 Tax=Carassius auratus TaxID=7957 RepID=A0A6P6J531_CARAU|nr:ribonuclease inhibitor-like isoform X1 [Carassius auratus]
MINCISTKKTIIFCSRLSDCSITEEGYKALASALRSNPSHLIELDLTGNDPGQSGVKQLSDLLQDEQCSLKTIRFLKSPAAEEACEYLTKVLGTSPLFLTELDLSEDKLGDLDGEKLSSLLMDSHSKLEKMKLNNCDRTEKSCSVLATVLSSKTILKEMNLNNSRLLDSGVKEIFEGLKNPVCELKILKLSDCSITEEGYKTLTSSLRSNSHLIELDLTGNDPGESGVKDVIDLLRGGCCKLKTVRFLKSPAAQKACDHLTEVLGTNPLLLKELDLSEDKLGDLDGEKLSALLMDSHNKVEKMKLNNCELIEKSCSVLATVLSSKTILKEMNLNNSRLLDSGVKEICEGLKNPVCELKILKLSDCSITEEGYKALASALRSNPSHLIELDLRGNDPGQSGVKELNDLLQGPNYSLKTLRFLGPAAEEACKYLTDVLHIKNPLLLRELNLSEHELGDTRVNQISALLQDKHCTLNTLMLKNNSITEKGCAALISAFYSNPSNLIELDLSGNKLGNSGIEKICLLLKNPQCKLKQLKLSDCSITEEGYKALASALRSNPSHLIELDLTGNDPGQSGVKQLSDLLQDEQCSLKTIRFLKSPAAEEACEYLTKVLGTSPLFLTELDLSEDKLGDLDGEKLSSLLMDSHSKLEKMKLNNCDRTEKSCSVLATVLSSKTILKEMNLNNSRLLDSGVKEIFEGLKNPVCELKILKLSNCALTEESCSALASVLSSDSSSLKDLDLSNNTLKDSGVELISDGLKDNCKLEKLCLSDCSITEEGYKALASALRSNPSHLIELDLTGNDPGQSGVKELNDLLQGPNYSLKTLR